MYIKLHDLVQDQLVMSTRFYLTPSRHCRMVANPHMNMVMLRSCARTWLSFSGQNREAKMKGRDRVPPTVIRAC